MNRAFNTFKSLTSFSAPTVFVNGEMASTSSFRQSVSPNALRAYLAEFISTFFFVLVVIGSTMASRKLMPDAKSDPVSLVTVAVATAFGMSSAVYVASSVSGGHVNPAVTFGMAVSGHISIPNAIFYWGVQMLASVIACLLLRITTVGQHVPNHGIAAEMTGFGASMLEGVLTFALVYTVFASADPRRGGSLGAVGPLAIGFMAGANVLAAGPFTGGSMNPACSFGAAAIAGSFKNQAVYWVGPLIGAAMAALLYDKVVVPARSEDSLRGIGDGVGV